MVKLIVEENGARRAFRMGKGVLTVGSGPEARLKLSSTEVAEIHFELELGEGGVKLRVRPGVLPPKIAGGLPKGEGTLAFGRKLEIGGARLWLEPEEGEAPQPVAAVPAPARTATKAPGASRVATPRRERPEGPRSGGKQAWLVPVLALVAVAVLFFVWRHLMRSQAAGEGLAQNKLRAAEQALQAGRFDEARAELSGIPSHGLTPEQSTRQAELTKRIEEADQHADLYLENESGTRYLDTLLKKYEGLYLQGKPEPAKVRLFLKRCREFRQRWSRHPELDWVARQEARFAGYVDMNAPATWEDVSWEVKDIADGMPRNYVAALALLDELLARTSGEERKLVQNRRDELVAGRPEYATDRLYQAQHEYTKKQDTSKAIWWLVHNIAWLGDEALANDSARVLVKMPDLPSHLLGYKARYPERYAAVMANAVVSSWASEAGFKP